MNFTHKSVLFFLFVGSLWDYIVNFSMGYRTDYYIMAHITYSITCRLSDTAGMPTASAHWIRLSSGVTV